MHTEQSVADLQKQKYCNVNETKSRKVGNNGNAIYDYIKVTRFNVVFLMMIELSCARHEERINGSPDNKVKPGEPFNNFKFSLSIRKYWFGMVLVRQPCTENRSAGRTRRSLLEDDSH